MGVGKNSSHGAADVAVKRQARSFRRRLGDGKRDAENCVRAELRFVFRAVELDQRLVNLQLIFRLEAAYGVENLAIDRLDGLQDAFAAEASLVAVTQFDRFARAGRSA